MTKQHHIASSGPFLLLTCLVLGTHAILVKTLPPVACPELLPATDVLVESSCSHDKIGCPDEGGAYAPVTTCSYGELSDASVATAEGEQSSYGMFECDYNASVFLCPLAHPKVGNSGSPLSLSNEIGRKYDNEKECFCPNGQLHCAFNECSAPAYPATQPGERDACPEFSPYICSNGELCCSTDADEVDDAVRPRPVLSEVVVRHDQRRGKRDKGEKRRNAKKNGGVMWSSNSRKLPPGVEWRAPIPAKAVADGLNA